MTRAAVAGALGISVAAVRRLEGKVFHPVRAADGYWYFDPGEVEAARPKVSPSRKRHAPAPSHPRGSSDGELAARLFPLFERGASFDEVVEQARVSPAAVRALFWEWRQGYGRPVAPAAPGDDDDDDDALGTEDDERSFAAWEAEVCALDREQARIDRLARRYARRWSNHR
jgi:hypothetical protein